jgi:alpha-beta hydrolase superfamily lysophospholipase
MGALISMSYAVSDREQPDLYVLSAPALDADVPVVLKLAAKTLAFVRPKTMLPNSIKGEQLSRDPSVGTRYFDDPLVINKGTARMGASMLAHMGIVRERLHKLSTPAIVIHGADDELIPPHASAPLAAIPGVERKLFAGLRHEVHNEPEQDEVLGFVVAWLDDQLT